MIVSNSVNGLEVSITAEGFEELGERLIGQNLDLIRVMKREVRRWTKEAQKQAVQNVSGSTVVFSGGSFVINRQTGKLARSIQTSFPTALSGVVIANTDYAAAINAGVPFPVDLKPSLMGKTVFIPFDNAYGNRSGKGPILYPVQSSSRGGNNPQDPAQTRMIVQEIPKFSSGGKRMGSQFGIFRRVGPNSVGWIIPPRLPRPFMDAAAEAITPKFEESVLKAYRQYLEDTGKA